MIKTKKKKKNHGGGEALGILSALVAISHLYHIINILQVN